MRPRVPGRSDDHFLYVGDDEPRKNVEGLIAAHEQYKQRGGRRPLVIAGAAAGHHGGEPNPTPGRLAELDAAAAALVHPSRDEGFGLTVLEAMTAGVPVIAVRNAAIEELAAEAAEIVESDALADAMLRLDKDDSLRRSMAEAGRRRAERFTWQRSADAHIEAYTLAARSND